MRMKARVRNIIISSVVGAAVVVAIVVPCVLLIPSDDTGNDSGGGGDSGDDRPTYTFDDYLSNNFGYSSLYPTWDRTDTTSMKYITRNSDGDIVTRIYNKPDTDVDVLITGPSEGDTTKTSAYSVSADNQYIWYRRDWKQVWRHSYTANFAIYRMNGAAGVLLDDTSIAGFPMDGMIHHMEWSPTGHNLAIVYDWDIWIIKNLDDTNPTLTQVTADGQKNKIYNGIPDWVYEEEMISANNVLYWAPDSNSFAFLRTDDTNTPIVEFSMYNNAQYPETVQIAYPKAGTTNPTVTLHVYDLGDSSTKELQPPTWPSFGANANFTEYYFSRFTWLDENTCLPTWTDRPQTASVGSRCARNTTSGDWTCTSVDDASTEYVSNGWVGSFGPFNIIWKDANTHFTIYARPNDGDATDGRWQIAKVDWTAGAKSWLTKTDYDIIGLYFYDAANDWLYYTAAAPEPRERHVYRVKGNGNNVVNPECMTCQLDKDYENRCGWITPRFNIDRSVAIVNCRGYREPMTVYYTISAEGVWSTKAEVIYDNQELVDKVSGIKWPEKRYGTFKYADYDKEYQYQMFVPADFDDSGNTKYPLLIEVYAGPEFQSITDTWTRGWASTHMVSDKNIIVASVDGRGSAYEGYKFMREAYLKLGQNEPVDQTAFAKFLAAKPYIDENLVGIWGWSYGGYTTSHTIGYDAGQTFKCGIAVAPLADWRYYDSMYAERYMARPEDNEDGYTKASIVTGHVLSNFKNAEYTLIHGTADDNVHFQNAAAMEKALVEADVDFDTFFYADQAHSINKGNAHAHIYRQLTTRMSHCLGRCDVSYPGQC